MVIVLRIRLPLAAVLRRLPHSRRFFSATWHLRRAVLLWRDAEIAMRRRSAPGDRPRRPFRRCLIAAQAAALRRQGQARRRSSARRRATPHRYLGTKPSSKKRHGRPMPADAKIRHLPGRKGKPYGSPWPFAGGVKSGGSSSPICSLSRPVRRRTFAFVHSLNARRAHRTARRCSR